jgi:four helix bundle protein
MSSVKSYHDLLIWQKALTLTKILYPLLNTFPQKEQYALTTQMRRTVISVPSNIAEGQARKSSKEFQQFLYITLGSLAELETQVILAAEFKYFKPQDVEQLKTLIIELQKMIYSLLSKISLTTPPERSIRSDRAGRH